MKPALRAGQTRVGEYGTSLEYNKEGGQISADLIEMAQGEKKKKIENTSVSRNSAPDRDGREEEEEVT
jgi:hypothetical protein